MTRWATFAPDAATSFQKTLQASAQIAIAESGPFGTGTAKLLAGQPLHYLAPGIVGDTDLMFVDATRRATWEASLNLYSAYHRLIPQAGTPVTFWAIDPRTGSLLGVLADGSGGSASCDIDSELEELETILEMMQLAGGLLDIAGVGVFATLGRIEAHKMAVAIRIFDTFVTLDDGEVPSDFDKKNQKDDCEINCEIMKDGLGFGLGPQLLPEGFIAEALETLEKVSKGADIASLSHRCPRALRRSACLTRYLTRTTAPTTPCARAASSGRSSSSGCSPSTAHLSEVRRPDALGRLHRERAHRPPHP
jgi:hypothetical protein